MYTDVRYAKHVFTFALNIYHILVWAYFFMALNVRV